MNRILIALAALALTVGPYAMAQNPPLQESPLQKQWQMQGAPPVQQAPDSTGPSTNTAANPAPETVAPPPSVAPGWPNVWLPATAAKLQALDKVNAQATTLTIKVGESATFGSLTVTVKACMTRPADQPADAAAYLDITDSHPDQPPFDGWMLQDEPAVSMMQHPIYDLRVAGCA
jgi:hypothetical protein